MERGVSFGVDFSGWRNGAARSLNGVTQMAQDKTAKSDAEQPRDRDGRFTEKGDALKSSGSASKSKDSGRKSAGGAKSGASSQRGQASKSR